MGSRAFAFALIAGAAVRLAALPLPGTQDVKVWKNWSYNARKGVTRFYGVGGDPPVSGALEYAGESTTVDYPPVALYEMGVVGVVYGSSAPGFPDTWRLTAAVKLPGFFAGLLLTFGLYTAILKHSGRAPIARLGAIAHWLNPAMVLNAEVLGYLDPLVMAPAVWSLIVLHDRRFAAAGALAAVAVLTKPQGVLVAPALLVGAWRLLARESLHPSIPASRIPASRIANPASRIQNRRTRCQGTLQIRNAKSRSPVRNRQSIRQSPIHNLQ